MSEASALPRLHVVMDDGVLRRPDVVERAAGVLAAGGHRLALHVRGPRASGRAVYERTDALRPLARAEGALLFVNDRVDMALALNAADSPATGAEGRPAAALSVHVHLGERSLPVADARRLLGPDRLIGRSVHDAPTLVRAASDGANFVFVGTVFPTASHPERRGIGVDGARGILREAASLPAVAIGGVEPDRTGELVRAGAYGVAVLTGVWSRTDPAAAVLEYLEALADAVRPNTGRS